MTTFRTGIVLLALFAVAGCVAPPKPVVESFASLGSGETVVVGRVELVPPLAKEETEFEGYFMEPYRNTVALLAGDSWREIHGEPGFGDYSERIETPWGETFFVQNDAEPLYILLGVSWVSMNAHDEVTPVYFPGDLKVDIRPGDRAVYMGTLRYHRNEFFQITKVEVVNDYKRANREFRARFGPGRKLRRALARKVQQG